jgi:hypothetical protein
MDLDESQLDDAIREHLAARLDGQLGRAQAAFRDHVAQASSLCSSPDDATLASSLCSASLRSRAHALRWLAAGAALAAGIVVAWLLLSGPAPDTTVPIAHPAPHVPPAAIEQYEKSVVWRTIDDGTVMVDDQTAARQFRRQFVRRAQWYDPNEQASIQVIVPRQEIIRVGLDKY